MKHGVRGDSTKGWDSRLGGFDKILASTAREFVRWSVRPKADEL